MKLLPQRRKANRRVEPAPKRRLPLREAALSLSFVGALSLAAWGAVHLTDPSVMPVRYVEIRGDLRHLTPAGIRDRVKGVLTGNFIDADTAAVRRSLEALPWVRRAAVTRVWPDTLRVTVVEQSPLARWGADALVNDAGQVFRPAAAPGRRRLPLLDGAQGDVLTVVAHYETAVSCLRPLGIGVQRLALDRRHAWRLSLSNGISVVLGKRHYDQRLLRFSRYYRRVLGRRAEDIDTVDLRYSNGFAVRWRAAPGA